MAFDFKKLKEKVKEDNKGGEFITEKGYYVGEIISCKEKTSKSSMAEWIELTFKTKEDKIGYIKIFYQNSKGGIISFGAKIINDLISLLDIEEQIEEFGLETALKETEDLLGFTIETEEEEYQGETRINCRLLNVRNPFTLLGVRDNEKPTFYWEDKIEIEHPQPIEKTEEPSNNNEAEDDDDESCFPF
jgi:hypothetical protein